MLTCARAVEPQLETPGSRFRMIVDRAVETLWAVFNRPGPDGNGWAEVEGFETIADYRHHLASEPDLLANTCRDLLWVSHLLSDEEQRLFQSVVDVADALAMRLR